MSGAGGPGKGPSANAQQSNSSTSPDVAMPARDQVFTDGDVLIAKYGQAYRWWPSPDSRKRGSQRWLVPSVDQWHPAASIEAARASYLAREVA